MSLPIAREGAPFILIPLAAAIGFAALAWILPAVIAALLTAAMVGFFRDPERAIAGGPGSLVSPADGKVVRLHETDRGTVELSIFLAPWNVHINRSPASGVLVEAERISGGYKPAYEDEASQSNAQTRLLIRAEVGEVKMRQVVGFLARRIVLWKRAGDTLRRGERIGLMKFGSRVDLEFPKPSRLAVREGEMVRAGESILAEYAP